MLSLRKRSLIIKIIASLILALMLWAVIAVVFGIVYVTTYRQSYYALQKQAADNLQTTLYIQLDKQKADTDTLIWSSRYEPSGYIFSDYEGVMMINGSGESIRTARFFTEGDSAGTVNTNTFTVYEKVMRGMVDKLVDKPYAVFISTVDYWRTGIESVDSTVYYIVAEKRNENYVLLMQDLEKIFKDVPSYEFYDICLWLDNAETCYSKRDNSVRHDFPTKLNSATKVTIRDSAAYTNEVKIDGENVVFSLAASRDPVCDTRMLAYRDTSEIDAQVYDVIVRHAIESVIIFLVFIAAFGYIAISFMKNNDTLMFAKSLGNYILNVNASGRVLWSNSTFAKAFQCKNIADYVSQDVPLHNQLLSGKPVFIDLVDEGQTAHTLVMTALRQFGHFRLVGSDMSGDMEEYRRLKHIDTCDSVTDLPIEKVFRTRIDEIMSNGKGISGSLALIGIANVGSLKTMLGEHTFKQVLSLYANGLKREWLPYGELYYLKSGNFLFFTDNAQKTTSLVNNISLVMDKMRLPVKTQDNNIILETRVGVVVLNTRDNAVTADSLLSNGQLAFENAINSIRQNYYVLHPTSFTTARTNFTADGVVKRMVENGEIATYFQPQYSLVTNRIVGFEALCRIVGNKSKEIAIHELISIAEQYGGMVELGNFVAEKAMEFAKLLEEKEIAISVNVSPIQLMQAGFTDQFIKRLERFDIKENSLNVEITEGAALYSFDEVVAKLTMLRNKGVGIHIDDFGVAYSSMLHLKLLPSTCLKIDKSLVDDICENQDAVNIVKNIINLSKDLNLVCIAEGVEMPEQLELLRDLGCDLIQGFIIGRALPKANALELIKEVNDKND